METKIRCWYQSWQHRVLGRASHTRSGVEIAVSLIEKMEGRPAGEKTEKKQTLSKHVIGASKRRCLAMLPEVGFPGSGYEAFHS